MKAAALAAFVAVLSAPASSADFTSIGSLAQDEFTRVASDLGAAFSYKGVTPATALGVTGFDVGIEVTDTSLENSGLIRRAGGGGGARLTVPKLHVYKGLPLGFDVGGFVAAASEIDATVFGLDLRYAIMNDGLTTPAIALRASGTRATGLGELSVSTAALDLMISKRFTAITPFAGIGTVRTVAKASVPGLDEARVNEGRVFAGVNVNLLAVNLAIEAEKAGSNRSLSAKLGWRF
jgi:hypothetical protein